MLKQCEPECTIEVIVFGCPHMFGQQMVSFLRKHYCKVSMFQVGYDAKLFVSAILSNQMIYEENRVVPYEEVGDNVKGYFAVLNSGSSP